jgi:competence protein ComEC
MPLLWLCASFLAGLVLSANYADVSWPACAIGGAVFVLLAWVENRLYRQNDLLTKWRSIAPVPITLLLAVLLFGAARYQAVKPADNEHSLLFYNDGAPVEVTGLINAPPDVRDQSTLLQVKVSTLRLQGGDQSLPISVNGMLMVYLPAGGEYSFGDVVQLQGRPVTPSEDEDFSYREYLAQRGIYTYMTYPQITLLEHGKGNPLLGAIFNLRQHAYVLIKRMFPQPESALLSGILLGLDNDIPADLERAFQDTGTAHIIAISG